MSKDRVLIVEDEQVIRHVLTTFLTEMGVEAVAKGSAEDALEALETEDAFGVALLDIVLPGMNGLGFLAKLKERCPDTEAVMMTSHASIDTATQAIRNGAYDYIHKPFEDLDEVWETVRRGLERRALVLKNRNLLNDLERRNRDLAALVRRRDSQVEAGRAMGGIYELPQLLDFFVALVATELGVDRASIMLLDDNAKEMFIAASRGLTADVVSQTRVRIGEGIAGKVAEEGEPILVQNLDAEKVEETLGDLSNSFISAPIKLSVPIKSSSSVLGVINVTDRTNKGPFTEADRAYIEGLAGQAAVAIERAKHVTALRRAHDDLEIRVQERTRELQSAKEDAESAVHSKNLFFANMSHELRTPLHGILSFAKFGKERAKKPEMEKLCSYFERIETSGGELLNLVDDLLDMSKLETGSMQPETTLCDLRPIVESVIAELQGAASENSVEIRLEVEGPVQAEVDGSLLARAIHSMISNGLAFTPEGGTIQLHLVGDGNYVAVAVEDSGPNIPAEELDVVFDSFMQSRRTRRGTLGNGLGLAICRDIVRAHVGTIWAEQPSEGGARFVFRIPARVNSGSADREAA